MKNLIILLVICSLEATSFGATLLQQSDEIGRDLSELKRRQKQASDKCRELEAEIKTFNEENNATNAQLTGKRKELTEVTEKIRVATEELNKIRATYEEIQGKITAKFAAIDSLRNSYYADLRARLAKAESDRVKAKTEKDQIERKLRDNDNFNSAQEFLDALNRFYVLKNLISALEGTKVELNALLKKSPPTQAQLEAEILALKDLAKPIYDDIIARTAALQLLVNQSTALKKSIAELEAKTKALSNFEVPSICKVL